MAKYVLLRRIVFSALLFVIAMGFTAAAVACPTCKDTIAHNDPHHQNLVAGYFYSILLMLSTPFVVAGSFAGYAYYLVRRARPENHAASAPSPADGE